MKVLMATGTMKERGPERRSGVRDRRQEDQRSGASHGQFETAVGDGLDHRERPSRKFVDQRVSNRRSIEDRRKSGWDALQGG